MDPWLSEQRAAGRRLVLVGASGGYTLPWERLRSHPDKIVVEPDPIARFLLSRRDPSMKRDADPALGWTRQGYWPSALRAWFDRYQGCAFLFCNLLGQLDETQCLRSTAWSSAFLDELSRCPWLSYHDLVSSRVQPDLSRLSRLSASSSSLSPELAPELWQEVYRGTGRSLQLVDHGTAALFASVRNELTQRTFLSWPLIPGRWHVIEGLASATHRRGRESQLNPAR